MDKNEIQKAFEVYRKMGGEKIIIKMKNNTRYIVSGIRYFEKYYFFIDRNYKRYWIHINIDDIKDIKPIPRPILKNREVK